MTEQDPAETIEPVEPDPEPSPKNEPVETDE